jgi:hypothetical protein
MKLSEVVREVVRLGDASRAYWDRELPKHHPRYPMIRAGENSPPPPPEDAQIQALLKGLPENQLYALMLLTYVGRGDFSADHLLPAYQTMKEMFPSTDMVIAQITENTTVAEYLTDAMEEMQKHHIDPDSLKFAGTMAVS